MAPFNPDVAKSNPDKFLGYSQGIEQPKADISLATLFEGLGKTMTEGVKGTDESFKAVISDSMYKQVDKERQELIGATEPLREDMYRGVGGKQASLTNGMDAMAQAMPDEIEGLENTVSNLQAAQQGGKLSLSGYWQAIDNIAKDFRARYPGYREYIDQTVSSITGHNPANAYMSSLIQDINRGITSKQDPLVTLAVRKAGDFLYGGGKEINGQHGALLYLAQTNPSMAMTYMNLQNGPKRRLEDRQAEVALRKVEGEDEKLTAIPIVENYANDKAKAAFDSHMLTTGKTYNEIYQAGLKYLLDPSSADPQAILNRGLEVRAMGMEFERELIADLNEPRGPKKLSLAQSAVGPGANSTEYVKDLVARTMRPWHDLEKILVGSKDISLAAVRLQQMQALHTNDEYNLLKTPEGDLLRVEKMIEKYPAFMKEMARTVLSNKYKSLNVNQFVDTMMKTIGSQGLSVKAGAAPVTLNEVFEKYKTAAGKDKNMDKLVYRDFADFGKKFLDTTLEPDVRLGIAAAMFHPKNLGFLSNIEEDHVVTGADGKPKRIQGKYALWNEYTSPAYVAAIEEFSKTNPDVKKWYKTWTEQSYGSDLFGPLMRKMGQYAADGRIELKYNVGDDSTPPFLSYVPGKGFQDSPAAFKMAQAAGAFTQINQDLALFNEGIRGMSSAFKLNPNPGQTAASYPLALIKSAGVNLERPNAEPRTSGEQVIKAISEGLSAVGSAINPLAGGDKKGSGSPSEPRGRVKIDGSTLGSPPETTSTSPMPFADEESFKTLDQWLKNPGKSKSDKNWINEGTITIGEPEDIPEGMDARTFIKIMKERARTIGLRNKAEK